MTDWAPVLGLPLWAWLFVLPSLIAAACFVLGPRIAGPLGPLWRALDWLYLGAGCLSAVFMCTILGLIVAQMIARWTGFALPGTTEFAGYAMAATSFFALAHALTRGAHIRVSIILNANAFLKRWLDLFAVFGAAVIATYFARYAIKANGFSALLNDRTQGQDQIPEWLVTLFTLPSRAPGEWGAALAASEGLAYTPIWIPQLAMSAGTVLLAVALWDTLCRMAATGRNPIVSEAVE
ncbi:TRAP transporter small permease [Jannaschia donghaensis]|uniref:TRAP transporter small permease protein n=1 Tax=Jannaschia donghaensis TaxID=420998 RepID=A0A0M6YMY7_9RHOB|nr:TRAP transporter small permease subunit [Jannaschia donghaensis]CTQ51209.1 TRAP-type C4-dicarboxylate transport system, small permease component [Jannaschia donghaensis]